MRIAADRPTTRGRRTVRVAGPTTRGPGPDPLRVARAAPQPRHGRARDARAGARAPSPS